MTLVFFTNYSNIEDTASRDFEIFATVKKPKDH
jgi:hypothetical protein